MAARQKKGPARIALDGELTIYRAQELKDRLMPLIAAGAECELDLAGVTEVDTAGIQLLLLAKREMNRKGATLRLTGHSEAVMEAIDLYGLTAGFGDPVLLRKSA